MNREAVQHERGPRTATLRKQMDLMLFNDKMAAHATPPPPPLASSSPAHHHSRAFGASSAHLLTAFYNQSVPSTLFKTANLLSAPVTSANSLSALSTATIPFSSSSSLSFCSSIYEAAARILFLNSKWSEGLPPLSSLPTAEQVALLSPTWRDLFVMGCGGQLLAADPDTPAQQRANVCEAAARILFLNSKWAQHLPSFAALSTDTQVKLMSSSWKELFILGCGQFLSLEDVAHLADNLEAPEDNKQLSEFLLALSRIKEHGLDSTEFACLRAIRLFSYSDIQTDAAAATDEMVSAVAIADLQTSALVRYVKVARPDQPARADQLLALLTGLATVASTTVRDLFFRATIGGHVDIDQIVIDMFKNSSM
jgi:nuclear receptor subfamily 2 group E protein 1